MVFLLPPVSSHLRTAVVTPSLPAVTRDDLVVFFLSLAGNHLQTAAITPSLSAVARDGLGPCGLPSSPS